MSEVERICQLVEKARTQDPANSGEPATPVAPRLSKSEFDVLLKKVSKYHMPKQEVEALLKRVSNSDQATADKWVIINVFLEDLVALFGLLSKQDDGNENQFYKRPSDIPPPSILGRRPSGFGGPARDPGKTHQPTRRPK